MNHLKPDSSHTILYLALCLLHEMRLGEDSPFYGYIQSLPRTPILLPAFWPIEELAGRDGQIASEIIRGTEVEREIALKAAEGLSLVRHSPLCPQIADKVARMTHGNSSQHLGRISL